MSRTGFRVCERMVADHQPIQFPQQRQRWSLLGAVQGRTYTRERQPSLRRQPQLLERLFDQPRGLDFLEPQFRMMADRFADLDDLVGTPIDGVADLALDFFLGGHRYSFLRCSTINIAAVSR